MLRSTLSLCLLCLLSALLWSTGGGIDCESRRTCRECISVDSVCGWCASEGVRIDDRCRENGTHANCDYVFFPESVVDGTVQKPMAGIVPERYEVSLRTDDTLSLPVDVTTARNIPLDLYIVFDLSQSLAEEIGATQQVSDDIIDRLQEITSNVQVGVGAFIDKPIFPYTRLDLSSGECYSSAICYNFRHYGQMTDDRNELRRRFNLVQTGSNIDAPEAGLDALAQIGLCEEEVGWRDNAVKMILYFTDDAFKFAGEGRQGGIMAPFEDVCGLETDPAEGPDGDFTVYTGLKNDYTSPGQLLHIMESANIVPVFIAVTSLTQAEGFYDVRETHMEMARLFNVRLNQRASWAELNSTGSEEDVAQNVLRIIDEQVLLILEQTGLNPVTEGIEGISFAVEADCPPGAVEKGTGTDSETCSSVGVGNTTEFTLSVTLLDCELFGTETKAINVTVFPLGQLVVEITPICACNCSDNEVNSRRCSFNGNYSCGECTCKEGYCGLECQIKIEDQAECPVGIGGEICSGERGTCLTCECLCEQNLTTIVVDDRLLRPGVNVSAFGGACECDYYSCLSPSESMETDVCSGRGDCCNGECVCHQDMAGYQYRSDGTDLLNCDCKPAEVVCVNPNSTSAEPQLCSGVGECGCERCNCPVPYTGSYCETVGLRECFDIGTAQEIEECITERGTEDPRKCQICSFSITNVVNISCVLLISSQDAPNSDSDAESMRVVEEFAAKNLQGNQYEYVKECSFTDDDSCTHYYYLVHNKDDISELIFIAESQRTCPSQPQESILDKIGIPLWALAIILLAVLLILGVIILVIIKVIFLVLDYFEVKRLEKEVGMADFSKNQNPLYQSPDVEYKNVAYGKE